MRSWRRVPNLEWVNRKRFLCELPARHFGTRNTCLINQIRPMPRVQQHMHAELEIPFRDFHLNGELIVPEDASGVVLFAHGSGSSRYSPRNQFVARTLREYGVGTLLFDLLTPDEEQEDQLTGHLRFDINLLAQRLLGATDWFHNKEPNLFVGYFGSST